MSANERAFLKMLEEHVVLPEWAPPQPPSRYSVWARETREAWMKARGIQPREPEAPRGA